MLGVVTPFTFVMLLALIVLIAFELTLQPILPVTGKAEFFPPKIRLFVKWIIKCLRADPAQS